MAKPPWRTFWRGPSKSSRWSHGVERGLHARTFRALRDPADVPHAIAAWASQCEAIVTYDSHFKAIAHLIPYRTPDDLLP